MKHTILASLLSLLFIPGFSQDLKYEINPTYSRSVKQTVLNKAQTMNDITPNYPASWISNYISVEVVATCNGKEMKAAGKNDTLTIQQKNLLATADMGRSVRIDIKYTYNNFITENNEFQNMNFELTIVPETEAQYFGGDAKMKSYLSTNALNKISDTKAKPFKSAIVRFTVDENGEITNAKIAQTSEDKKTDKLLLKAINNMPKWKPAQNANGVYVKQQFEFIVGSPMTIGC